MSQNMDSILQQINQNSDNKSRKELLKTFSYLVDEELLRLYRKTDCVDNYQQNFIRFRQNGRQFYQCVHNSCHFSTNKSSQIVRHIRRHLKQKPYLCPISGCDHQFYQRCDLKCHLMRHLEDKPFICNQKNCANRYTTRKALTLHIKSHSPFGFKCQECHQLFATNWKLNKHLKIKHKLSGQSVTNRSTIELKSEPKPEINVDSKCVLKTQPKSEIKSKTKGKQNVNSMTNQLTNDLIESIDAVNEQIGDQLVAEYKTFSAKFGFEQVVNYLITDYKQSSPEPMTTEDNTTDVNTIDDNTTELSPVEPMDTKLEFDWNSETVTNSDVLSQTSDYLFKKYTENMCSLIEIYRLDSNGVNKKVLFKCFQCMFTSDSIDVIIGHVLRHISDGLTETLRNKTQNNFN